MNTPPGLLAAGLLFWGWQTHSWVAALFLALVLEGARVVSARWEFSESDLRRVWNLCTLLFVGATIYSFSANDGASGLASLFNGTASSRTDSLNKTSQSVLVLIQWLPMIFFPMALVQAYGARETMDMRVFSWIMRARALHGAHPFSPPALNVGYPYLLLCLLGASTSQVHAETFYAGLFCLLAATLWSFRNKRFPAMSWLVLLGAVGFVGYAGQLGLSQLQKALQRLDSVWLSRFSHNDTDAIGIRTALGRLGELKLSGRIVLRVKPITEPPPALLRQASYNGFDSPWWFASKKKYHPIIAESDETTWRLLPNKPTRRAIRVAGYLPGGQGILSVPNGTAELRELGIFTLKTNELGVLRVDWGPGLVDFVCHYDEGQTIDTAPDEDDLRVPAIEQMAVNRIVRELDLKRLSPTAAAARVEAFFRDHFVYSTYSAEANASSRQSPLAHFLTRTHSGHCEYFASATTLILRAAGIPARYAVGYALVEKHNDQYLVRERHAHAWALAYINHTWRDIDTTPPSWGPTEAQQASLWEPLRDLWSQVWFGFSKWRWSKTSLRPYLILVLIPPLLLIALRLIFRRRSRHSRRAETLSPLLPLKPGADSEFYLVEERLANLGWKRPDNQPLLQWLSHAGLPSDAAPNQLADLAALHYRYRFDPRGLSADQRAFLKQGAHDWLTAGRSISSFHARASSIPAAPTRDPACPDPGQ